MEIIALTNQKGGVGKTTTAINLGVGLAKKKKRVLIVDLDPQANLTSAFGIRPDKTIYDLLNNDTGLNDVTVSKFGVDIVPSEQVMARLEKELLGEIRASERLGEKLVDLKYDYILIDCPPSLGLLTLNGLTACDSVIIPMEPEPFALEGIIATNNIIHKIKKMVKSIEVMGVLIIKFHRHYILDNSILEYVEKHGFTVFDTKIRTNKAISEAQLARVPIYEYSNSCNGAKDYKAFTKEVLNYGKKEKKV